MNAIQVTSTDGPEVLEYRTGPDLVPSRGEVLVLVHTSDVNFIDGCFRNGHCKAPRPLIPGAEGSGYIAAVGEDVSAFEVGDAVAWLAPLGSYAQRAVIPVDRIMRVPADMEIKRTGMRTRNESRRFETVSLGMGPENPAIRVLRTDNDLVQAAQSGDHEAFAELCRRHAQVAGKRFSPSFVIEKMPKTLCRRPCSVHMRIWADFVSPASSPRGSQLSGSMLR
ncbi:alcohol dehydrogenase catalytic domain-containing protein [Tunturiibacter gelidiferens]|uniref:alcohol dehydrogenase catalytic domain-containing protein n=1 Tax=Tunturiibacter gelidiferens TaxID=3069689 RepID=UPI003D9AE04F